MLFKLNSVHVGYNVFICMRPRYRGKCEVCC